MPRPRTRPCECVRRSWHSDTQQPMRGIIIQQLLRALHESHSPVTRKNKEWQEKLPIVVLKAEEIMYSKANSEAEYMDLQTLWERVNDAVNTIIKRDENTEGGDLLLPCVEAGLNLGCVPVRDSRSQRHINLRSYPKPKPDKPVFSSSRITETLAKNQNHQFPNCLANQSSQQNHSSRLLTKSKKHVLQNTTHSNNISPNMRYVCPFYYGTQFRKQPKRSLFPPQIPSSSKPKIASTAVYPKKTEPPILGSFQSPVSEANAGNNHGKAPESGFDLSLRLGSCNEDNNKFTKEFLLFPVETSGDPSGFGTSRWRFDGEGHGVGPALKKSKAHSDSMNLEDEIHFFERQLRSERVVGQINRPSL